MRGELPPARLILIHVTLFPEDTMGDMKTTTDQPRSRRCGNEGSNAESSPWAGVPTPSVAGTNGIVSAFCDLRRARSSPRQPHRTRMPSDGMEKEGSRCTLRFTSGWTGRSRYTWYRIVTRDTNRGAVAIVSKYGIEDVIFSIKEPQCTRAVPVHRSEESLAGRRALRAGLAQGLRRTCPAASGSGHRGEDRGDSVCAREQHPFLGLCWVPAGDRGVARNKEVFPMPQARSSAKGRT